MNEMTAIDRTQRPFSNEAGAFLARGPRLLIDGEWAAPDAGASLPVEDPSSAKEVARIADASAADVDRAVVAARTAFDDGRWSGLAPVARERALHKLADLIERDTKLLAELEAIDNGKPVKVAAAGDIPAAVAMVRYHAGWATKLGAETVPPSALPADRFHAYVRREPIGVAALIVPWNFPLLMAVQKVAPALAAGCTCVLKPAEQTSLTALYLGDLALEAGIPAGVLNIVTGRGEISGDALVKHPQVDKVAFTGSTEVGKLINRNATESLKRVTLELGGKSPLIVLPDMDPKTVSRGAAAAIFRNSGQVCIAGSRIYAHRDVFDDLVEGIAASAPAWAPRPSLDPQARMGPLVSGEQMERVLGYIEDGRQAGASIALGGDAADAPGGGYYVNPTVLVDVAPDMRVVKEEIFGPVVVAQRFDDLDEVAKDANDSVYGLGASIWTRDLSAFHTLAAKIKAGTVWGNTHAVLDPALPFGGYKESGFGRELGRAGVESYSELKTVMLAL